MGPRANTYTLLFGAKGQGKTTWARMAARRRAERGGCVTWVDPTGCNGDLGIVVRSVAGWWAAVRRGLQERRPWVVVVQPGWGQSLAGLWELVYEVGHQLLVLDEAEQFASAHRIDAGLGELVSLGRNRLIDIISTVRTPPELHGRLRGNRDVVITFRQVSAHYARSLDDEFFHLGAAGVGEMLRLRPLEYLRSADGVVTRGRLRPPWAK